MKLVIKRTYCPVCQKLVRAREQAAGPETQVICTQCGRILYSWNGIRWIRDPKDQTKQEAAEKPAAVGTRKPAASRKTT